MTTFRAVDLVARKRDGGELSADELEWLIGQYLDDCAGRPAQVSEAQISAVLMAGVLNGFTDAEAEAMTDVLVRSGETLDLSGLDGPTIDKHSTGGVGDGTTLLVAPLLASAGAQAVKLSGRGLGHTGGTLDKLESVPGLRTDLEPDQLLDIVATVGCVVAAQSERLVPADRALYALRDVTATVPSPALIASSVMSKKLAAGADTIVLDVKAGDGAFMTSVADATALAALCVRIGRSAGRRCTAFVTDMSQPLGSGIGNALEVAEAVELLQDEPSVPLAGLSLGLAATALALARGVPEKPCRAELEARWASGEALEKLRGMIEAQGGDPRVCDDPRAVLPEAPVVIAVPAPRAGHVAVVPARAIGALAAALGAGRARKQDPVDPAVGIKLEVRVGDQVERGQPLAFVHARTADQAEDASRQLVSLVSLGAEPVDRPRVVLGRVGDQAPD